MDKLLTQNSLLYSKQSKINANFITCVFFFFLYLIDKYIKIFDTLEIYNFMEFIKLEQILEALKLINEV